MYQINKIDQDQVLKISKKYNLDMDFAKLLISKNFCDKDIYALTHLDTAIKVPFNNIVNAKEAGAKIAQFSSHKNNLICIFGDYDGDGITGTYTLYKSFCKLAKCKIKTYIPQRAEGYGLNMEWCKKLVASASKYEKILVITVDNGITKKEEVAFLQKNNIEVIITDHHLPQENSTPDCLIVNPQLYKDDPNKHLAGCGVAFKVGYWIQNYFHVNTMEDLLDMLAIGTICDMMPMTIENIAFCYYGLKLINSKRCRKTIQILKEYDQKKTYSYKDIGFSIGPRINACGRLGQVELAKSFIFEDYLDDEECLEMVMKVIKCNESRKTLIKNTMKKIDLSSTAHVFLIDSYIGIAGIIANEILKRTGEDTIVFAKSGDLLKGSLRSDGTTNVIDSLRLVKNMVHSLEFGGHKSSAGLSIKEEDYDSFCEAFESFYADTLKEINVQNDILIDFEIKPCDVNHRLNDIISTLPYDGQLLKEPVFLVTSKLLDYNATNNNPNNAFVEIENIDSKIWSENIIPKLNKKMLGKTVDIICTMDKSFIDKNKVTIKIIDIFETGTVHIKNRNISKTKSNKLKGVCL